MVDGRGRWRLADFWIVFGICVRACACVRVCCVVCVRVRVRGVGVGKERGAGRFRPLKASKEGRRGGVTRGRAAADGDERVVPLIGEVVCSQVPVLDVVQRVAVRGVGWSFPLQLEHDHPTGYPSTPPLSLTDQFPGYHQGLTSTM